jgi:hypothetical protein
MKMKQKRANKLIKSRKTVTVKDFPLMRVKINGINRSDPGYDILLLPMSHLTKQGSLMEGGVVCRVSFMTGQSYPSI